MKRTVLEQRKYFILFNGKKILCIYIYIFMKTTFTFRFYVIFNPPPPFHPEGNKPSKSVCQQWFTLEILILIYYYIYIILLVGN